MFLRMKHRKLLKQMKEIEVSEKALENYKAVVRSNKNLSEEKLIKKLKRNFVMSEPVNEYCSRFGNLFIYHKDKRITSIFNEKGKEIPCNINFKLKKELNKILEI